MIKKKEVVVSGSASVVPPLVSKYFASKEDMELIRACASKGTAALLIGETGVGKTTIVREVAKENGKNLIRISVNGSMGVEEILGKWLVEAGTTKWQDGILTAALRKGDWVVMDEINAALPEILFVLHSLLDEDRKIVLPEKDNEVIVPHTEFRFFATMNPPEEYAGTKDMNKALTSRFSAVIWLHVLSEKEEVELLCSKGASFDNAVKLVGAASVLRKAKEKDDIFYFCSTRDLVQTVELMQSGVSLKNAFRGSVINKMNPKEFDVVKVNLTTLIESTKTVPAKSMGELLDIASRRDSDIKSAVEKANAEFSKKEAAYRAEIEKLKLSSGGGSATVRADFIKELRRLATEK